MDSDGFVWLRRHLDLTQENLAERMGISVRAIQEIERNKGREVREVNALAIRMVSIIKAIEETNIGYLDKQLYFDLSGLLLNNPSSGES